MGAAHVARNARVPPVVILLQLNHEITELIAIHVDRQGDVMTKEKVNAIVKKTITSL